MKYALPPLVHPDSKILIMGTMPGEKSIALQQYYGNRGNHFWKILLSVFNQPFTTDYNDRKAFLKEFKIALWNVLSHCEREGSQDNKIKNETVNDLSTFHSQYPDIRYVFFESKAAAKFFDKYATPQLGIIYTTLPSTSGLNAAKSFDEKLSEWKRILDVF